MFLDMDLPPDEQNSLIIKKTKFLRPEESKEVKHKYL